MEGDMTNPIVISGPAVPETLRVLRAVAASVGARLDLSFDRIDELRMTVDEAATLVLRAAHAERLTLELATDDPTGLRCAIRSDGPTSDWPGDRAASWAWRVVSELAPGASMDLLDGCPGVAFRWEIGANPATIQERST